MAEQVQAVLDGMVAPCQDWQTRGIFTGDEIHQIMNRRRNSEYDVRRRHSRKADFLRYIANEVQLERLRALRTKTWQTKMRQDFFETQKKKQQQGLVQQDDEIKTPHVLPRLYGFVGDKHVIQHVHYLWTRTLRKYRSDVALYLEYAEFCKTHVALHRLSALYAEALQFHGANGNQGVGLWIEASSHEFFYNNNASSSGSGGGGGIANARILLQRAIRLHPTSHDLWLQLFTLELHWIQKLKGRKQILLGSNVTVAAAGADNKTITEKKNQHDNDDDDDDDDNEDEFKICRIVYKNAMSAVAVVNNNSNNKVTAVTFCCRFWDTCRLFPATQSLQNWIIDYSIVQKSKNSSAGKQQQQQQDDPQAYLAWALHVWDVEQQKKNRRHQNAQSSAAVAVVVDNNKEGEEEEEENDDDDDHEEQDQVVSEPHRKKPRCNQDDDDDDDDEKDNNDDGDDDKNATPHDVVSILDLAIHSLPTPEMYLKAIRMMVRYVEYLYMQKQQERQQQQQQEDAACTAKDDDDKNNDNTNLVRATRWIVTTFQKAATIDKQHTAKNKKLYTSDMVLEHVDFLTRTTVDVSTATFRAIQVLQDFVQDNNNQETTTSNNNIHAKVWVRLAKLVYDNNNESTPKQLQEQQQQQSQHDDKHQGEEEENMPQGPVAAIEILKLALQSIPMTRKEHLGMMLHLFGAKMQLAATRNATTTSNRKGSSGTTSHDDDEAELFSLFQRILLLAPGFVSDWQGGSGVAISNSSSISGDKDNVDKDDDMMVIAGKPAFDVGSVTGACLLYLQHAYQLFHHDGMHTVRKVYRAVLYESSILNTILRSATTTTRQHQQRHDDDGDDEQAKVAAFVEQAIQMEREASKSSSSKARDNGHRRGNQENKKHLHRLYDTASKLFGKSAIGDQFRHQRYEDLLYGGSLDTSASAFTGSIPHFDASLEGFSHNDFISAFGKYQVVHVSNIAALQQSRHAHHKERQQKQDYLTWTNIAGLFERLDEKDKASWCIETPLTHNDKTVASSTTSTPSDFLQPRLTNDRGYCSFLVQKDQEAYRETLQCLPVCDLPSASNSSSDGDVDDDALVWQYDSPGALWIFFGRNNNKNVTIEESASLKGRPEHTDSISTDGTWHYQLAGKKTWCLRPTGALLKHMKHHLSLGEAKSWTTSTRVSVECRKGDVIVINTSLWFHATNIPFQSSPSVSYARDFFLRRPSGGGAITSQKGDSSSLGMTMTNLDGLYANCDVEEATVIFRESEMPDCELHRSSINPNCEVVELEDGTNAVVSTRPIMAGEFFSIAESSSSEDEEEEDDDDDDHGEAGEEDNEE